MAQIDRRLALLAVGLAGLVLAAIAVTILPELAREFSEYRMLIFGAAMVLMMVWRPQGLMPMRRIHIELKRQE